MDKNLILVEWAYEFNTGVSETDWLGLTPEYYKCAKGSNTDMLIINGENDLIVPNTGIVETKVPTNQDAFGVQPSTYSVWNMARLNTKTPANCKKFSDFKLTKTFDVTKGTDRATCN